MDQSEENDTISIDCERAGGRRRQGYPVIGSPGASHLVTDTEDFTLGGPEKSSWAPTVCCVEIQTSPSSVRPSGGVFAVFWPLRHGLRSCTRLFAILHHPRHRRKVENST